MCITITINVTFENLPYLPYSLILDITINICDFYPYLEASWGEIGQKITSKTHFFHKSFGQFKNKL